MLIAQISDLHITVKGKKAYGIVATIDNLKRCVTHINRLQPSPDVVLVTGDICYSGLAEEAKLAASILDKLNAPYYVISGNHDNRKDIQREFRSKVCPVEDKRFIHYVINDFPIRLIGMDSTHAGQSGGKICKKRASWLDKQLAKEPQRATIIFMHHPPLKLGMLETDEDGFIGADLLASVVKKYSNIKRILCGHIHRTAVAQWNGTLVSTTASMGMSVVLDLSLQKSSRFFTDEPVYHLHYCSADKTLVTHTLYVSKHSQTHFFKAI